MDPNKRAMDDAERVKKKQKVRHYFGLRNQGATCYLNSVLQIIFMTSEIHDRLDPEARDTDHELKNLFGKLTEKTCETKRITKTFGITNVYQQYDAALCLEEILHKVSPQVSQVFQGQLSDATTCSQGHRITEETNPFLILPLALKDANDKNYDVKRGFEGIFQEKSFSGNNMMFCNECDKKTEATSKYQMSKFPRILILLLKRFDRDYSTMEYVKSDRHVEVPGSLQRENRKYKLYGMVNHMGGLAGGHYTATILSEEDQTWYEFNDSHVEQVEEQPFANAETHGSRTAYLLVYREIRRKKEKKKVSDEQKGHTEERQKQIDFTDSHETEKRPMEQKQAAKERPKEGRHQNEIRHQIVQNGDSASTRNKTDGESLLPRDKEKRPEEQNQAVEDLVSEQGKKEECSREVRNKRVHGKVKREDRASKRNRAEGEPLFVKNQDMGPMSETHQDNQRKVERERPRKKEYTKERENKRSTHPLKDPIILAVILSVFFISVILILIVTFSV